MEDEKIIELYFERSEQAVIETDVKYGKMCLCIAKNIINSNEDAEECVNDTYLGVWNSIPPTRPKKLSAYIAKITRNLAFKKVAYTNAKKRTAGLIVSLEELDKCFAAPDDKLSRLFESEELEKKLECFLAGQSYESRNIFLRRYWFMDSITDIAKRFSISETKVRSRLFRTRNKLKKYLSKEGDLL